MYNIYAIHRGVEQLVARRAHNPEVAGSNPASATKEKSLKHNALRVFSFSAPFGCYSFFYQFFYHLSKIETIELEINIELKGLDY